MMDTPDQPTDTLEAREKEQREKAKREGRPHVVRRQAPHDRKQRENCGHVAG
jgi:hypothetical protein